MRSPLCTRCIFAALGLSAYWHDFVQGILQEVSLQYDVSAPVKHVWEGEEEIWVAEDIAGHGIAVLVDFFQFSFDCFFSLVLCVGSRIVVFAYDANFKFCTYCTHFIPTTGTVSPERRLAFTSRP
jgi:hypothetical protein